MKKWVIVATLLVCYSSAVFSRMTATEYCDVYTRAAGYAFALTQQRTEGQQVQYVLSQMYPELSVPDRREIAQSAYDSVYVRSMTDREHMYYERGWCHGRFSYEKNIRSSLTKVHPSIRE